MRRNNKDLIKKKSTFHGEWMVGWIERWTEKWTDNQIMGGQTYEWMDMQYMCIDMQKNNRFCDFYKSITNRQEDRLTNRPTDRRTDLQTLL